MFSNNRRKTLLVSMALVGAAGLLTACQDSDPATDTGAAQGSPSAAAAGGADTSSSPSAAGSAQGNGSGSGKGTTDGSGSGSGSAKGSGGQGKVEQTCGADDVTWSTKSMTQAGGYILISAKAKPGITCLLPAENPFVSFGTDIVAQPAEQAAGEEIKLSGSTTAYAGVNPKTTNTNDGKQWSSITVGTAVGDPNATDISLGTSVTADKPVVTNWHSLPTDAVPAG